MLNLSMMNRKQERVFNIIIGGCVMAFLASAFFAYYSVAIVPGMINKKVQTVKADYEKKLASLNLNNTVLVATRDINPNEVLDSAMVKETHVPLDASPNNAIRSTDFLKGKLARIKISKGSSLTEDNVIRIIDRVTNDMRKVDWTGIRKFYKLNIGDYIDIRMKKRDGTDVVVVSKKQVKDIQGDILCFDAHEAEIQFFSSAAVESVLTDCTLYTALYIDPHGQEPAFVTYKPNPKIVDLVNNNPNVLDQAQKILQ